MTSTTVSLYTAAAYTISYGPTKRSRRQCDLHHYRQMVGNAAGVARACVGAEGLLAGVDIVASKKERYTEDAHFGGQRKGRRR